jgi:hypothetical protein
MPPIKLPFYISQNIAGSFFFCPFSAPHTFNSWSSHFQPKVPEKLGQAQIANRGAHSTLVPASFETEKRKKKMMKK